MVKSDWCINSNVPHVPFTIDLYFIGASYDRIAMRIAGGYCSRDGSFVELARNDRARLSIASCFFPDIVLLINGVVRLYLRGRYADANNLIYSTSFNSAISYLAAVNWCANSYNKMIRYHYAQKLATQSNKTFKS